MDLTNIKSLIPEYAKDLRLNISSVLTPEGAPGLDSQQILGTALAAAIASRNARLVREIEALAVAEIDEAHITAARAAASIMGMNNVYYRFTHLVDNDEYSTMPARLRMNVIGSPGIPKANFELYSLVVSAINGCGACMAAHERTLRKVGLGAESVQSGVRIGAVIHAIALAIESRPSQPEGLQAA